MAGAAFLATILSTTIAALSLTAALWASDLTLAGFFSTFAFFIFFTYSFADVFSKAFKFFSNSDATISPAIHSSRAAM
ncbi:MAG TPA: hypothetical protein DHV59_10030 [Oxalobacteraceae bacterium]|nr:hypothetical protein [Oxalobacteraceae bacterium]